MLPLHEQFGQIDIYLFDQLLRRPRSARAADPGRGLRFRTQSRLPFARRLRGLRSGSGSGGRRTCADARAGSSGRHLSRGAGRGNVFSRCVREVVLSSAVLHFARDEGHFAAMLNGTWRVLKPGGLLFCRLASSIGIENQITRISGRRFLLPDGTERYLVDENLLAGLTESLGGRFLIH